MLPALRDGDWLMFPFAGAYTICAASNYGGVRFTQPLKLFIYSACVHRETCGFDMAAGVAAAAAAVAHAHGADGSCCGSDHDSSCAMGADAGVCVDSDNSSNSGDGGSPHAARGSGSLDGCMDCLACSEGGGVTCLLCGAGGGEGVDAGGQGSVACGRVAALSAVDDGCMSVASEGTAAGGVSLEGCQPVEGEVTSMVFV